MEARNLKIPATDGHALGATVVEAPQADVRGVVIINSAMATPRRYYRHMARALAEAGFHAVAWDYRGTGESRPEPLRRTNVDIRDWVERDMTGILDWAAERWPGLPRFLLGHSVDGQIAGMLPDNSGVAGMLTVSSQSGHWRYQGGEQKAVVLLHTWVTLPVLARLFGYLPGKAMGSSEDLPKSVAVQWAGWCRNPKYLLGDTSLPLERFDGFTVPVLAYSIDDDKWGTARSVDAMMGAYPNLERRHIVPGDHGLKTLGHFGFFRKTSAGLWTEVIDWLLAQLPPDETRQAS